MAAKSIANSAHGAVPLKGRRIVITRARQQAGRLAQLIEDLGGEVVEFPTIEICPPDDYTAFDAAIENIETYHWVIFTSVNGVAPFLERMHEKQKPVSALKQLRVGAIGPETAKALSAGGIDTGLVPPRFQAEGILETMMPQAMRGQRVLIPRAAKAREVLPETLRQWGAAVDVVVAYRTVTPATDVSPLLRLLQDRRIDVITFTSSSTVSNFVRLFKNQKLDEILGATTIACIGPITENTVCELGGQAQIVAREFTIAGLVDAIVDYFAAVNVGE